MTFQIKADPTRRFIAALIDNLLATGLSFLPIWGGIVAAGYILFRDGFDWPWMCRKSLGKQIMKLNLIRTVGDAKPDLRSSIARNWMLALPPLAGMMPFLNPVWLFPLGAGIWLLEGLKVIASPAGIRFGDQWAKTQVINPPTTLPTPEVENRLTKKSLLKKRTSRNHSV